MACALFGIILLNNIVYVNVYFNSIEFSKANYDNAGRRDPVPKCFNMKSEMTGLVQDNQSSPDLT